MAGVLTRRLIAAVYEGRVHKVDALLRRGASPCAPAESGETPLYVAAVSGHSEIVRLLLEAGAAPDTESRGEPGSSGLPLCAAASWGHDEAVRKLLAHGADPDRREDDGTAQAPLLWAAGGGHHGTAVLLQANADPDAYPACREHRAGRAHPPHAGPALRGGLGGGNGSRRDRGSPGGTFVGLSRM